MNNSDIQDNIRALVFDFGGVISKTLFETHSLSELALGLAPGSLTWRGPFDPANDSLWRDMQDDKISERDYWLTRSQQVGELLGEQWNDMQTLVRRARGQEPSLILRPQVLALILQAKQQGFRLALLSNELDLFYGKSLRQRLGVLEQFEVIIDASYTGILKPAARAYQLCLAALQLPASQCLMIDDQPRNVKGAQKIGMPSFLFDVQEPSVSCEAIARRCQITYLALD